MTLTAPISELNYARASLHRDEIRETLWTLQDLMCRVLPEVERTQQLVDPGTADDRTCNAGSRAESARDPRGIRRTVGARRVVANRGRGRLAGASSFQDAIDYVAREGELARDHEVPIAVWSDNVASIETAALEMAGTASQSKAKDPLCHLIVSWAPDERPNYEQARDALNTQLRHLGFEGCSTLLRCKTTA